MFQTGFYLTRPREFKFEHFYQSDCYPKGLTEVLFIILRKKGAEIEIKTSVKQYVRSNLTYSLVTDCDPFNRACKKPKEKINFCRSL